MNHKSVREVIRWLLLAAIILYVASGFGITEYRTVESLTFGLLTKNLAFRIHDALLIPSVVLLVLHTCFTYLFRLKKRKDFVPPSPAN